jgi:hypothetical protein
MNSKLENLNEKIIMVKKLLEQNKDSIKLRQTYIPIEKEEEKQIIENYNIPFKTKINIDKSYLLKGKINELEDQCNTKLSKLKSKYDALSEDINKLSDYLNSEYENENSYNINLIGKLNNIKNDLCNNYEQENNNLEQEINYYNQNLNNKIQLIDNYNTSETLKDKRNILNLEKFSEEIINEIINKIKINNENSDTDKKERAQDICNGLMNRDNELTNEINCNDVFFEDLRNQMLNIIEENMKNFISKEETKREAFKNNILEVLNETLNNIIINKKKE